MPAFIRARSELQKESQDEQPFSDEELKIIEEVRRECGAQDKTSKRNILDS